jgi:fumarate hydratase class I
MQNKVTFQQISDAIYTYLQYISYAHSPDFILTMTKAYHNETNSSAKEAIKQILINSKMCAENKRPICQDTGMAQVFLEIGMQVQFADFDLNAAINDGVRRAYTDNLNPLRASMVSDAAFSRTNTKDNTPAIIMSEMVAGDKIKITLAAKGCGSENKAKFAVLEPDSDIKEWVLKQIPKMGAGWCPPGVIGIGIGGSAEKAMLMAKQSLMDDIDIFELKDKSELNAIETLRLELFEKINNLKIGAQGLGGLATTLDVKIKDYPTHAASKPIALIANCAATRHISFQLGDAVPEVDLSLYPQLELSNTAKKLNLNTLTRDDLKQLKMGDNLLISGTILTARDKAHKKICKMVQNGENLPFDLTNKFIYYVGPVDSVGNEVIGPAGPTTSTRMDKFSECILDLGALGAIGKAERGQAATQVFAQHQAIYFIAVGGAAYLISKSIKKSKVVAFAELGMEAVYEFEVQDMPVVVAIDSTGENIHQKISF